MSNRQNDIMTRDRAAEGIAERAAVAPAVDVYENKEEILILADVPGVAKDAMNVHFEKGKLTLEARRADTKDLGRVLAAEYRPFDFRRTFAVPQGIDAEKIVAELKDGVLKVHLPKAAALKVRQIPIGS